MTDIGFYHLTRSSLEQALPKLLEKVISSGKRAVVRAGSEERVQCLNAALWTYEQGSFLPHGSNREGQAEKQPIWLTGSQENPNGSQILIVTDGAQAPDFEGYERCLEMFNGNDPDAVAAARERWKAYRDAGHELTYWQQTESGGWMKKDG